MVGRVKRETARGRLCLGLGSSNVFLFLSSQRKKVALRTDGALLHVPATPLEPDCAILPELCTRPEWPSATRGRRHAHADTRDGCPLGEGRCCHLQSLRASLEDLGWADWVLAPRELDVRMCVGACPSHFRSANTHAQMQARLHGLNPDAAPAPCCVPASYEPVVLMHQDSDGRVSLTPFDDLVAKDCHCV